MRKKLMIAICCLFAIPLTVKANSAILCEDFKGALGLTDAVAGIDNKSYDISADYFSGGPLYSLRLNSETGNYTIYPLKDVFQISKNNAATLLITNHWCLENGELSSEWVGGQCGCESFYGYSGYTEDYDNDTDFKGIISEDEFQTLERTFSLSSDYAVSTNAYGAGCNINNAIAWFRFDYASKNIEKPIPPRAAFFEHLSDDTYINLYLSVCTGAETLVYKIWSECVNELNNKVFFENMSEPSVVSQKAFGINLLRADECTVFALTNDPFRNIISFSPVNAAAPKSKTGSEQPVLEQSGADIRIEPSSQVWWSASPAYRAKKLDDGRYEVKILRTPFLDECVPAGEYIYFFADHNCSDADAKCLNYAGISIVESDLNKDCQNPEISAVVLEHELKPVLINKPFLAQKDPPSYNTFFNSCAILPGEILKRQKENSIEEKVPQRAVFTINDDVVNIGNCGEEILEVEKVVRECTDDRKSRSFYSLTAAPWKIKSGEDIAIDLIKDDGKGCYYDCEVSIFNNDPFNGLVSTELKTGTEPLYRGTKISIKTGNEENVIKPGELSVMEITIENKDCLEMVDPIIRVSSYFDAAVNYMPPVNIDIVSESVEIVSPSGDLRSEIKNGKINLSGTLPVSGKVTVRFSFITGADMGAYYDENSYRISLYLSHKNFKNEIILTAWAFCDCAETSDSDSDAADADDESDMDQSDEDNTNDKESFSSGCAIGF